MRVALYRMAWPPLVVLRHGTASTAMRSPGSKAAPAETPPGTMASLRPGADSMKACPRPRSPLGGVLLVTNPSSTTVCAARGRAGSGYGKRSGRPRGREVEREGGGREGGNEE